MIRLAVQLPNRQNNTLDWSRPAISIGRAPSNDIVFPADNVSSQHAQITLQNGNYLFRDLRSTNGTVIIRKDKRYLLKGENNELPLESGDRICLASLDHEIIVESILATDTSPETDDNFEKTIIAEEISRPAADLEKLENHARHAV
jgi:pSer/pThr/pTyr-binding forkhead associated (FHA) protein